MTLGFNGRGSPSRSESDRMDGGRGSLDSGYQSMVAKPEPGSQDGPNTFIISDLESSPERSPRKLHQNISPALSSAMQAIAKTVRSTTSYIYPSRTEPELPSSEWSECETPKKLSRRSSIMSSVRKRTHSFAPQTPNAKIESPEPPPPPVPVTPEKAPALDVEIPNPCLSSESFGRCQISRGSQLLAGIKLPAGPKNLWPGPTRLTANQASGGATKESLHPVPSKVNDFHVDQEASFQPNMGSRAVWERHRADRERRYMEIVDIDSRTESDDDVGSELQLVRSTSKQQSSPVNTPVTPSPVPRSPIPRDSNDLAYRLELRKRQMKLLRVRGHKDERPPWRP